jgi:hypothetical protein
VSPGPDECLCPVVIRPFLTKNAATCYIKTLRSDFGGKELFSIKTEGRVEPNIPRQRPRLRWSGRSLLTSKQPETHNPHQGAFT